MVAWKIVFYWWVIDGGSVADWLGLGTGAGLPVEMKSGGS